LASAEQTRILSDIDSIGFDAAASMGFGGFVTMRVFPVVLFKNGDALTDVGALAHPGGLAAHRSATPGSWTTWRRQGAAVETMGAKGWRPLSFSPTYATLPPGFRLEGLFRLVSGTGTLAAGGTDSVAAFTEYTFSRTGRVVRGGGAGAFTQTGDVSTASASLPPDRRGTYHIDGLMLVVRYEDGHEERRILVTDPNDPKGAIWLDGTGYARRTR
jgi:hypothetical protein